MRFITHINTFVLALSASAIFTSFVPIKTAHAQSAQTVIPSTDKVEELLVIGEQPGPSMWKVTKGDNTLWIVGTHEPVPQKMKWRAKGIREIVAQSQEILSAPSTRISTKQIGFFNALTMVPAAMESRKNPNGESLKDIVPADIYQRWIVLRDKYIDENNTNDEDKDIERWRPMFAALELYSKAITKSGMTQTSPVWPMIRDTAKQQKVNITDVMYEPAIGDARGALKEFSKRQLADIACFTKTVERIETDLSAMRMRANAWAKGDLDLLRISPQIDQRQACNAAVLETTFAKMLGVQDMAAKVEAAWMRAAEAAINKNRVTLAVLPMDRLLGAKSYLTALEAKGYVVVAPEM
jgi:hypothetical protein